MIPFLRLGEAICGGPHFPLTPDALKKVVTGQASREVLLAVSHAVSSNHPCCLSSHVMFICSGEIFLVCFSLYILRMPLDESMKIHATNNGTLHGLRTVVHVGIFSTVSGIKFYKIYDKISERQ